MISSLAFVSFPGILLSSPWTFLDATTSQLLESVSSELVTSCSESYGTVFARGYSVWSCAIEDLSFVGRTEVLTSIEHQQLGAQEVISSRKRLEYITIGYLRHYLLDEFIILFDALNTQNEMPHQSVLQYGLCPDNLLWDLRWTLLHSISESVSGLGLIAATFIQKLINLLRRKGFHLLMSVNSLEEFQSALVVYAAKGVKSLGEVVFESIGELVRESDFLLNQSVSVLQQESEFSYLFIRYFDRSESFLMFPDIVSDEVSVIWI
jgi:hypothetical protein